MNEQRMACVTRAGTALAGAVKLLAAVLLAVVAVALAAPGKADAQDAGGRGSAAAPDGAETVTVQSGDTLRGIAEEVFGDAGRWGSLLEANGDRIDDPDLIFPGQVLIVTAPEEETATAPAAAPAFAVVAPEPTRDEGAAAATEEADAAARSIAYRYGQPASPDPREEREEEVAPAPTNGAPSGNAMSLSVPALGISGVAVTDEASEAALANGAMHLPGTGFPWQEDSNTYIVGQRIGPPGAPSHRVFYDLPSLSAGDEVVLTDADGRNYAYAVSEMFAVGPSNTRATGPVAGRDVVTLETRTETVDDWTTIGPRLMGSGPKPGRLIVRADRVS